MNGTDHIVSAEALKAFAKSIFRASDMAEDHAEDWADMLIWAKLDTSKGRIFFGVI